MSSARPTITDIAKRTGLSIATVSRAYNHPELVNAKTAALIQAAMNDLGYTPRNNNTYLNEQTLLINIDTPVNSFYAKVIEGINASSKLHGYRVFIEQETYDSREKVRSMVQRARINNVQGIVFINPQSEEYFDEILESLPLVQCLETSSAGYSCVTIDNYKAVHAVMDHLVNQGKRRIVFLNSTQDSNYSRERQEAFENYMRQAGLEQYGSRIINLPTSEYDLNIPSSGYDMALSSFTRLLAGDNRPEAVFAVSDLMAMAVINAAKINNVSVPDDMLVAGFNNDEYSIISQPKITSVSQPLFNIGYTAVEVLYDYIIGRTGKNQRTIRLESELIIRESTRPSI